MSALKENIARAVAVPVEIDRELRELCAAIGSQENWLRPVTFGKISVCIEWGNNWHEDICLGEFRNRRHSDRPNAANDH